MNDEIRMTKEKQARLSSGLRHSSFIRHSDFVIRHCAAVIRHSVSRFVTLAAVATIVAGCGRSDNRAEVFGTVTANGQPVASGSISFVPTAGTTGPSAGGEITEGSYRIPPDVGPVHGQYRVRILAHRKTGRLVEAGFPYEPGTKVDEIKQYIPPQYNRQSELTVEIEPGENQHDFELTFPADD